MCRGAPAEGRRGMRGGREDRRHCCEGGREERRCCEGEAAAVLVVGLRGGWGKYR